MTRVPKFRAWDKNGKKMFTNSQLIIWNGNVYANNENQLSVDHLRGWSIDEKYLMQSTGLKDKNGTEIFVGDIIDFGENDDAPPTVVECNGLDIYFEEDDLDERVYLTDFVEYADASGVEVIGNVYENKELLE